MYIPKSKIITNLYTNGNEFVLFNKEYVGFYYKTADGKFYTGKTPEDIPNYELKKYQTDIIGTINEENINFSVFVDKFDEFKSVNDIDNYTYVWLKSIDINKIKYIPLYYNNIPTQEDYDYGSFKRYFLKKYNLNEYIEVKKEDYEKIKNKDDNYLWELYYPFEIEWKLTGIKSQAFEINKNNVERLNFNGFKEFLDFNFIKYYNYPIIFNQFSKGNEFIYETKVQFIGYYNINKEGFFDLNNNKLIPLNEDIILEKFFPVDSLIENYKKLKNVPNN